MKYEDVSWHSGGDFPQEMPAEAAATHTGMFVAWALLSGLAGEIHLEDLEEDLSALKSRAITPGAYFFQVCDGKFTDEDLNDEGNAFAESYFDPGKGKYLSDYGKVLGRDLPGLDHVEDTWANYDRLAPILARRFNNWKARRGWGFLGRFAP